MGVGTFRSRRSDDYNFQKVGIILKRPYESTLCGCHSSIGVTCLIARYEDEWPYEAYHQESTAHIHGFFHRERICMDDERICMTIYDVGNAGHVNSAVSATCHVLSREKSHMDDEITGVAFCYDVTRRETWDHLRSMIVAVKEKLPPETPVGKMMILACKCDLVDRREVDFLTVQTFAAQNDMLYFETSTKEDINVEYAFTSLAAQLLAIKNERKVRSS